MILKKQHHQGGNKMVEIGIIMKIIMLLPIGKRLTEHGIILKAMVS